MNNALEHLSAAAHRNWASWARHIITTYQREDGTVVIPVEKVESWTNLVETPYGALTAEDKEKDRKAIHEFYGPIPFMSLLMRHDFNETTFCDICIDFDGTMSNYKSGWIAADVIPDPPVENAIEWIHDLLDADLLLAIYSARSGQPGGITAMKEWFSFWGNAYKAMTPDRPCGNKTLDKYLAFPTTKPSAKIYYDDRGVRFNGVFHTVDELRKLFEPWYRLEKLNDVPQEEILKND